MNPNIETLIGLQTLATVLGGLMGTVALSAAVAALVARYVTARTPQKLKIVVMDREEARAWILEHAAPKL